MRLIESLSTRNVVLLADLFHMNIEEVSVPAATSMPAPGKHIGHLHFVDSNRRPAGMGHLDYPPCNVVADGEHRLRRLCPRLKALSYPDP